MPVVFLLDILLLFIYFVAVMLLLILPYPAEYVHRDMISGITDGSEEIVSLTISPRRIECRNI